VSELTREDVLQILDLIDKAHYDFFELQVGDLKLVVNNTGLPMGGMADTAATPGAGSLIVAPPPPPRPSLPPTPSSAPQARPSPTPAPAPAPSALPARDRSGLVAVNGPMVGVFYAQPEPGAPPFVEVGATIDEESTLGLIEVMKVYTAVRAGVRGSVAEILVHNQEFVEYGQPLFYIRPA
jgi:acetyl-CoA carboxylase biotin carboxyl carrier protein